ncbi:uncharacterized protein MONOS_6731 [Monocercomonoides exilis]|uniref:uncharacterized protein n=1 Tax=Monocercomonoides exilis TaxID=2049356 RepID=UPI00355A64B3|nr:hypothetical protein MONOS_6731 [Monocercomonoides exilis]|eukprot:MONOS_6731.1-p1 / transcript=MONOS_6731.1 / gene=MONOS_6731 / organism=Monocercomonoides_exilis_PA203 / gene_product=unspecified product / transcript_product=unspecified product / location=Mono_scaffold00217:54651-55799(-) / protein_length=383 / sequence_SO=supercontig / SO=protein_coding / is_pseudo=false
MQHETSENEEEFRGEDETDRTKEEEEEEEEFQEGKPKSAEKKTFLFGFDSQSGGRMAFDDRLEEERRWKEEKDRLDEADMSEATDISQKQQRQGDLDEKTRIRQHSSIFESRKRQKAPEDRAFDRNSVFLTSYSRLASASSGLAIPSASENGRGKEGRRTDSQFNRDDINHFSSSSSVSSSSLQSPHLHKTHASPRSSLLSVEDPILSMTLPSHSGSELLRMKEKQQQTAGSSSTSSSPSSSSFNSSSISPLEEDAFFRAVKHHPPPADLFFHSQRKKHNINSFLLLFCSLPEQPSGQTTNICKWGVQGSSVSDGSDTPNVAGVCDYGCGGDTGCEATVCSVWDGSVFCLGRVWQFDERDAYEVHRHPVDGAASTEMGMLKR